MFIKKTDKVELSQYLAKCKLFLKAYTIIIIMFHNFRFRF